MATTTASRGAPPASPSTTVLRHFGVASDHHGLSIVLKSLLVAAVHIGLALFLHLTYLRSRLPTPTLSLVVAFALVQLAAIVMLLLALLLRKLHRELRERRIDLVRPEVFECLASHSAGSDQRAEIGRLARLHMDVVESCLAEMLPSITGSGRAPLSELAIELGLVRRWQAGCRSHDDRRRAESVAKLGQIDDGTARRTLVIALGDRSNAVRLEAARVLLRSAGTSQLERIFAFALAQPLFVRAILIEELRPHALTLCATAVQDGLRSRDVRRVVRTLEVIAAWHKALPVAGLDRLLDHANVQVRSHALAILPYVCGADDFDAAIIAALGEASPEVQAAAAFAAGQLTIDAALPQLEQLLHSPDEQPARAAATALAIIPAGQAVLERAVLSTNRSAAAVALESLERARTGRQENLVR